MIVTHIIKYTLLSSGVSSAKCFLVSFPLLAVAGVLPEAEEDEDVAAADKACLPTSFLSFIWSLTVFKPHALNCSTVPIVLNMTSVSPSTPSSTSAAINASKDKFYKTDWLTKGLAIYTLVKEKSAIIVCIYLNTVTLSVYVIYTYIYYQKQTRHLCYK